MKPLVLIFETDIIEYKHKVGPTHALRKWRGMYYVLTSMLSNVVIIRRENELTHSFSLLVMPPVSGQIKPFNSKIIYIPLD